MVVGGFPRFQCGGYWFSVVAPWPNYWGNNWYETDDVTLPTLTMGITCTTRDTLASASQSASRAKLHRARSGRAVPSGQRISSHKSEAPLPELIRSTRCSADCFGWMKGLQFGRRSARCSRSLYLTCWQTLTTISTASADKRKLGWYA